MKPGKNTILIIGKTPPPIGGVTIHVNRLINNLNKREIDHTFENVSISNLPVIFYSIFQYRLCHIHVSHPVLMLLLTFLCKLGRTKSIITIHRELGAYSKNTELLYEYSIRNCDLPIVLNDKSLEISSRYNSNTVLASSFIPPVNGNLDLDTSFAEEARKFRKKYDTLFCANASRYDRLPTGEDLYGVDNLLKIFSGKPHIGLIISDPTGENFEFYSKNMGELPKNVIFLTDKHNFMSIINLSDCVIRPTLTDGDSISIKEALYLRKNVITSNVVKRPKQCMIYKDESELESMVINFKVSEVNAHAKSLNGFNDILYCYERILETALSEVQILKN